jgi:hypothetical protein
MPDEEQIPVEQQIERLNRRSKDLYRRVIDLEARLRSTNGHLKLLRNSFAVIYMVVIVLVLYVGVRWLM